jgi:hypothetical protein
VPWSQSQPSAAAIEQVIELPQWFPFFQCHARFLMAIMIQARPWIEGELLRSVCPDLLHNSTRLSGSLKLIRSGFSRHLLIVKPFNGTAPFRRVNAGGALRRCSRGCWRAWG